MNCKQGDLAIIVYSEYGNYGKLVRVIEPSPLNGLPIGFKGAVGGSTFKVVDESFCWVVEALGAPINKQICSYRICPVGDAYLRPIRDQPGDDETLTWAGKPELVTA